MKTNHDGTITLNAYDTWTSCVACGQRVTGDSIHTCSPQLKEQDTECKYCKQGCFRCDARKLLTDEEINVVAILQDAEIVPVGHEIWKTGEEFNKYKRIVLATAKALRKAQKKC